MNFVKAALVGALSVGPFVGLVAQPVTAQADVPAFLCQTGSSVAPLCGIAGSEWRGVGYHGNAEDLVFNPDGSVLWLSGDGRYYDDAEWIVTGNHITIEFSNNYATYEGTINGTQMGGTGSNKDNVRWGWSVNRQ